MMLLQRACGDESRVKNKSANGPLRVQSNVVFSTEYSATCWHTLVVGDMLVSCKSARQSASSAANQGGTASICNQQTRP